MIVNNFGEERLKSRYFSVLYPTQSWEQRRGISRFGPFAYLKFRGIVKLFKVDYYRRQDKINELNEHN